MQENNNSNNSSFNNIQESNATKLPTRKQVASIQELKETTLAV